MVKKRKMQIKHSLNFGKKEQILNYACQTIKNPVRDLSSVADKESGILSPRMPLGMRTNFS
jgi:hypothetical protein